MINLLKDLACDNLCSIKSFVRYIDDFFEFLTRVECVRIN